MAKNKQHHKLWCCRILWQLLDIRGVIYQANLEEINVDGTSTNVVVDNGLIPFVGNYSGMCFFAEPTVDYMSMAETVFVVDGTSFGPKKYMFYNSLNNLISS